MSEQEYLEMIVAERIQMILADMEGGAVMDGEEEWEKTLDGLEEAQRKAIESPPATAEPRIQDGSTRKGSAAAKGGNRKAFVPCRPERWDPSAGLGPVRLNDGTGRGDPLRSLPIYMWKRKREKPE